MAWSVERFGVYQASEWQVDIIPSRQRAAGLVPVVFCHGFLIGGQVARRGATGIPGGLYYTQLAAIADRGHPVLSADLGGLTTWANDTAIGRINTLVTWAGTNLGTRTDKVVIAGESMGSLLALNWAWRNRVRCAGIWVRAPIVRMADFYTRNAVFQASLDAAYTDHTGFLAALPTHDPVQNMAELTVMGARTRLDYSGDDEFIPPTWVADYAQATGALARYAWGDHAANVRTPVAEVAEWVHTTARQNP